MKLSTAALLLSTPYVCNAFVPSTGFGSRPSGALQMSAPAEAATEQKVRSMVVGVIFLLRGYV